MTNEERQKLCADLRQVYRYIDNDEINDIIWRAADEIERLAALAQSDAERNIEKLEAEGWRLPVNAAALANSNAEPTGIPHTREAGLFPLPREHQDPSKWANIDAAVNAGLATRNPAPNAAPSGYSNAKTVTIGAAAPRPDASAGLIEAAEMADKIAEHHRKRCDLADTIKMQLISSSKAMAAGEIAKAIRARATAPPRPDTSAAAEIYRNALERISKSNLMDMNTLHPEGCAHEAIKALRATDRSGK